MQINGQEIGFLFNVRARINVAQLTETKSIEQVGDLLTGDEGDVVENVYRIARIMNKEYEIKKRRDQGKEVDLTADYSVIKLDDIMELDNADFTQLATEVVETMQGKRTVESKPKKGKK